MGLAVDGSASNDGSSMLEEIRVAYLLHRLNSSFDAPSGYEILKMATRGSASVLGRDDIGQLCVGYSADAFLVNTDRSDLVGTQFDAKSILCTVGLKGNVDTTIVGGEIVVECGKLVNMDEQKIVHEAKAALKQFYR